MKKLLLGSLIVVLFLASCSNPKSKLIGTWKVDNVETDFGKTKLPVELVKHIEDAQKKLSFRIVSDSIMVLLLDNNPHEARWDLDSKTGTITYYFSKQKGIVNTLGKVVDNEIINETKMPLGKLKVHYQKQ
jgi:hypothetical protein